MSFFARFARRGSTGLFGKISEGGIGTLRLGQETEVLVREAAARARQPVCEYLRECIERGFHGEDEVERRRTLRLDQIRVVAPKKVSNPTE